jgi:DNA-binding response OmpR family regulator
VTAAALAHGGGIAPLEHSPERVLVVEDHDAMARFLARALSAAGFAVTVAAGGRDGLEHLAKGDFELVILDLELPDLDGLTVLTRMTAQVPDQPVLVLSGRADARSGVRCLELGACDCVAKPFALPELLARARLRARERTRTCSPRHVRRGRYVLYRGRRTVDDGERVVALTVRELALLEYLMRKTGETCGREELLAHVWGYPAGSHSNVVNVYAARLRHKLGPAVATERNVGYRFVGA